MGFCKRKGVECEYKTLCNLHLDSVTVDSCQKNLHDVEDRYLGDSYCHKKGIYCDLIYSHPKGCKACVMETQEFIGEDSSKLDPLSFDFTPNLNDITGVVDTETDGKKFAIGTKNHADTFVLNFKDNSCLLFIGDIQPIDLRKFNFDEFTCIEINGNKFVREAKSNL